MARTHIKAVAQEKSGSGTAAYREINSGNINGFGLEQVDYNVNTAANIMDPPIYQKRYWHIIQGHGVGGEHISEYPNIDPNSGYTQFGAQVAATGHEAGNLSVIFDYLNAGGSNIQYTKLEYTKFFSGETDTFVDLFSRHLSEEAPYYSPIKYTMEIYWGDYIKYYTDQERMPPEHFKIESIKGLSGEKDILLRAFTFNPGSFYVGSSALDQVLLKINLNTKKILSLPMLGTPSSITSDAVHTWTVETDDFNSTVNTDQGEASGTKISELSSGASLEGSDLFVLSRDEEGDGLYDKSYNVTFDKITDTIAENFKSDVFFLQTPRSIVSTGSAFGTAEYDISDVIPLNAKLVILESYWALNGPDGVGARTLKVNDTHVLAYMNSAGKGDEVAGSNQGIFLIDNGKIKLSLDGSINGQVNVRAIGYYL